MSEYKDATIEDIISVMKRNKEDVIQNNNESI